MSDWDICEACKHLQKGSDETYCNLSFSTKCENYEHFELNCTRPFFVPDSGLFKLMGCGCRGKAPEHSCLFCEHMTDVFWDYSNGPYRFYCELDKDTGKGACGVCEFYKEGDGYYDVQSDSNN